MSSPDISRQTLSALKAQIRLDQGRARKLRIKAAEKDEDFKRSECEELQLSSQADKLDKKLVKMDRQEARLNRKIYNLNNEDNRLLTMQSEAKMVIWEATYDIKPISRAGGSGGGQDTGSKPAQVKGLRVSRVWHLSQDMWRQKLS